LFNLPEGIAAVFDLAEGIEGSDTGEGDEFLAVEVGDSGGEVFYGREGALVDRGCVWCCGFPPFPHRTRKGWGTHSVGRISYAAGGDDGFGGGLAKAFDVVETDAEGELGA
jgi:hypothetical protein